MSWLLAVFTFIIGLGFGYVIRWRFSQQDQNLQALQRELEQTRFDLEQKKQDVSDYFDQSRELMMQLGQNLEKVNHFWNQSAQGMLGDKQQPHSLPVNSGTLTQTNYEPKDYVNGSHGIINEQKLQASN